MGLIWEISFGEFLFATLVLGGGAAWLAGRALAGSWEPAWKAVAWMLPLAGAVRFLHVAVFSGSFLTLQFYLVDLAILMACAYAGYRLTRAGQMARQYDWLFERAGPFGWRARSGD